MLDKTEETVEREVDKTAPALFVRYQAPIGSRTMEVSFGVPLDMTVSGMNAYIDKVTSCIDRQSMKGMLEQLRFELAEGYRRLETELQNLANFENKYESDWYASGRKGEWQPTGSQRAELKTLQTNIKNWRETTIPLKQKQIAELEEIIARGT